MKIRKPLLFILFLCYRLILLGQHESKISVRPAIDQLYMKCGNKLLIIVDSVNSLKELSYKIEGGIIQPGSFKNEIIVYPHDLKVKLHVFADDKSIGTKEFKVQNSPKPTIVFLADNELIKNKYISKKTKTIQLKAICDSTFTCYCPKDNLYKFSYRLNYYKKEKSIYESKINDSQVFLKSKYMKKADHIEIVIDSVKKTNFIDKDIEIGFIIKESILSLL